MWQQCDDPSGGAALSYSLAFPVSLACNAHRIQQASRPVEQDSDFGFDHAHIMARLAALQRLKDEMSRNNRAAMLKTIEQMMEAERSALVRARDRDSEAA
jgi:hypothetical protein